MDCPYAIEYRLSERPDLSDATFAPMTGLVTFILSFPPGEKTLYAEYLGVDGETRILQMPHPILYTPIGPQLEILAPADGAIITGDTLLQALAGDEQGIAKVEFWIDAQRLAIVTAPPYQTLWRPGVIPNGPHSLWVSATNTRQQSVSAQRTLHVQLQDLIGPSLELSFNGARLEAGATLTTPGTLGIQAQDINGVFTLALSLDGETLDNFNPGGAPSVSRSRAFDFATISNGPHSFELRATDASGNLSLLNRPFILQLLPPSAPQISVPANGVRLNKANLTLGGTAQIGSQVQIYLDGMAVGAPLNVTATGGFSTTLSLPGEGTYSLQAEARNARGVGARSEPVWVHYSIPPPQVGFISPAAGALVTTATDIQVNAQDPSGILWVRLELDGQPLASLNEPPYLYRWEIGALADGPHQLRVLAVAGNGQSASAERSVTLRQTPPPPPPTAYTGEVLSLDPLISYGPQSILIRGRAVARGSGQPVANAALQMVLQVGGFQRNIALASDGSGAFSYTFVPQASDAGIYQVSVVHPDETSYPDQGRFTINRVRFHISQYNLVAIRGFPSQVRVDATTSAGTGVQGLRWEARPQDQPGGALPPGIRIDGGVGIDIAPNASVPMTIGFQAEAGTPQESGTVFLVALARDSGAAVRGALRLDYRLGEAQPALYAEPTYLELGVRQGERVSGTLRIGNRGLATATGVTVRLLSPSGGPPPAWLFLASTGTLGTLEVGQSQLLQIIAAPDSAVTDGVFTAKVRIEASNATGGEVPISISVLQQGEGGVRFHLADLFTETLDAQGHLIPGLGGATLKVQNEAVTSVQHQVVTDAQGVALIQGLPPGAYRYRASAPNHTEVSGRLQIQPGVTLTQEVFLDYQIISVSFSVTETTIQDHYDLTLTATYQTQVPAPVVLLEPLAINLPDLQVGESLSGELSLTNYGLVQAEHLLFNPPASDEYYRYEFLGQVPQTLPAKTRINLPYRITARQPPPNLAQLRGATPVMGAIGDESYATGLIRTYRAATSGACSSYGAVASLSYDYQCANGEGRGGACSTAITAIRGSGCGSPGGTGGGGGGQDAGGFGGGGGGSHPAPIPLTPGCTPDCEPKTCGCAGSPGPGGFGPPGDGGDGGGGWSGGPGDGGGRPSPGLGGGGWPPGDFGGGFFIR